MNQTDSMAAFIIVAFVFAGVILFKRESIPERLRRGLALFALALVAFAFFLLIYLFLHMKPAA